MHFKRSAFGIWMAALLTCAQAFAQAGAAQPASGPALPGTIPLFPLEDAALFPHAARPFHIFEARYRTMIADALKGDRIIGMVSLRPGFESNYEGRPAVYAVGCAGVIEDFEELPDGRYNILLRGFVKFRIDGEDQSRAYRLAKVTAIPEPSDDGRKAEVHKQRQQLETLVSKPGADSTIPADIGDEEVIDVLAQYVPIDPSQRQALLELDGTPARARALIELIESKGPPR